MSLAPDLAGSDQSHIRQALLAGAGATSQTGERITDSETGVSVGILYPRQYLHYLNGCWYEVTFSLYNGR